MTVDDVNKRLITLEGLISGQVEELRVAQTTPCPALATSICRYFEEGRRVALSCIGAQAAANALKAIAIANEELIKQGRYFVLVPSFVTKRTPDKYNPGSEVELTAIRLIVGRIPIFL